MLVVNALDATASRALNALGSKPTANTGESGFTDSLGDGSCGNTLVGTVSTNLGESSADDFCVSASHNVV